MQVHHLMCIELMTLVDRVSNIFPEIEAARPRCSTGIQALCCLNNAIEKAKLLLQHCSESSKLYLAITGDAILSRCKRTRSLLEQGLSQIQNMVRVELAAEISRIIVELRSAKFSLDSSEEEAGKVVRAFLQQYATATDSIEKSAIETIQFAASRLQITSQRALVMERRSIKKLLGKVGDGDPGKKQILVGLLHLLKNYGQLTGREQTENAFVQHGESFSLAASCEQSVEVESRVKYGHDEAHPDMLSRPIPPEEFLCPLSLRLMYDPVIIASEQTFERMWIQKWFNEGHDTCPKTKRKLAHLSLTPNTAILNLISKWCMANGVTITDPFEQSAEIQPWEASSSSIASLRSIMNDLRLPIDFSNVSLESLDISYNSDSSSFNMTNGLNLMSEQRNVNCHRFQSYENAHGIDMRILSELDALSWESQCEAVENVKSLLNNVDQACCSLSCENSVEPLIRFLKDAQDKRDIKALRIGSQLLLAFVSKCRSSIPYLPEDAFSLLASFLDMEVIEETLAIMEVLSSHHYCRSKIAASGALASIPSILDRQIRKFQELAIKILYNLSFNSDICSLIVSSKFIPKLVPLFEDTALARYSISILNNLCNKEDARASVAETEGCIASIVKLLETDSREAQEQAVTVLLSLCFQRAQYCQLVMDEGVIPALFTVSVNGNDKGKASAMELLRLLTDTEYSDLQECSVSDQVFSRDTGNHYREQKSSSRASKLFGMKMSIFSKNSSLAPKKKK
ncbi:U-box domain-containing protein 5 isoform X2 [Cornus florida]|uniref:U-box domain-containing protein 5 isoform X2 n=1 Tax=Cornus florida TaxID=4283 RepID=UPI00289CB008|nr:U-box domain-containing protein 5 isoform X2 [Cornus florida]